MSKLEGFEKLYKEYYTPVYEYLLKLCGDASLAEELTQESFVRIWEKLDTYRGECKFGTWACSIAKNCYLTQVKKSRRRAELREDIPDEAPSLEKKLADKELSLKIHSKLHVLEEPYREVFWMRVFGELSFAEIAKLHGKTDSWARVTFHRAKMKIKEAIEE